MKLQSILLCLDPSGVLHVGKAHVPLDRVVAAYVHGQPLALLHAQFPMLSEEEVMAAIDYYLAEGADVITRGPNARDAHWRQWNQTASEDMGTDLPQSIDRVG